MIRTNDIASRVLPTTVAVCVLGVLTAAHAQSSGWPLSPYKDRNRVLIFFAPNAEDARYKSQIASFSGKTAGEQDRDLVRFSVFEKGQSRGPRGPISQYAARWLRRRYQVRPGSFRVLLIGKDTHVAYGQSSPVSPAALFQRIDRMPMRRDEMRRHP